MTDHLPDIYREQILALEAMPDGGARSEAAFQLAKDLIGPRAPWADTDPEVAARWLTSKGTDVDRALAGAAEFEHSMRALFAIEHQRDAQTFDELVAFMAAVEARSR